MATKKELKNKYKEMKFTIGVFQVRNTKNNKIFISSSTDINAHWNRYKFQLDFGSHINKELQKEWNEFGEESFVFEILSELEQDDDLNINYSKEVKELENMIIDDLKQKNIELYNL